MRRRRYPSLVSLSADAVKLGFAAQAVVSLPVFQVATGTAELREVSRMVDEKVAALINAHQVAFTAIASGEPDAIPDRVLRIYSREVAANRRRLSGR